MKPELTQEIVRELLHYDPETGLLYWKPRDVKWFKNSKSRSAEHICNLWNARYANKEALSTIYLGYKYGTLFAKKVRSHRIIWLWMTGEWPEEVDHENHNRSDNRWINLKEVTSQENSKNISLYFRNKSGCMGVIWHKKKKKWESSIRINGSLLYLGRYINFNDAVKARKEAEQKYDFHKNHGK